MIRKDSTGYSAPKGDRLDCSVRALSIAANMPYEKAHALFKAEGRKDGHRTPCRISKSLYGKLGYTDIIVANKPTVAQFLKKHHTGRFVCHRSGHAFAVVDGVVHDWALGTGARSRIADAYMIPAL